MSRPHPLGDFEFEADEIEDAGVEEQLPGALGVLDADQFSNEALAKLSETELLRLAEALQGNINHAKLSEAELLRSSEEQSGIRSSNEYDVPPDRLANVTSEAEATQSPQPENQAVSAAKGGSLADSGGGSVEEPRKSGAASGSAQALTISAALICIGALLAFVVWSGKDPCEKRIEERCGHLQNAGGTATVGLEALRQQLQASAEMRGSLEREAEELRIQEGQLRQESMKVREEVDGLVLRLGDPKARWNTGRVLDGGRFVVQLQDVVQQRTLEEVAAPTGSPAGPLAPMPLPTPAPTLQTPPEMQTMPGMMPGMMPMIPGMMPEPPVDVPTQHCPSDEVLAKMRTQMDEASDENDRLREDPELGRLQRTFMRHSQRIHILLERNDGLAKEVLTAKSLSQRCETESQAPSPKHAIKAEVAKLQGEAARLEMLLQASTSQ